ncbi:MULTISPECIES: hypothetical protein [Campylobacter]|uniref:hypothetical protein n=1 Tax=Campylobacter TaxID=194 RepID=UPI0023F4F058|nr:MULTISPECIES: hypothetical protein [Campylobacter]MCI6641049.1 hypothetical protein [Campylobacter sp.]MDD7422182.1 hypothetical protein [Campylobacter hominis]MDY3116974.1 hypothetical protein [Campylobacter hominis]
MQAMTKFSFELPSNEKDLIDIANLLLEKAKKFKTLSNDSLTSKKINTRLEFAKQHRHKISGSGDECEYSLYLEEKYGK